MRNTEIVGALVVIAVILIIALIAFTIGRRRTMRLPHAARRRYAESWRELASRFVDEPDSTAHRADDLVFGALRERGMADEEGRWPQPFRKARQVLEESSSDDTEHLRLAMLQYRDALDATIGERDRKSVTLSRGAV
ncbi:MAG TPA: hypothetical protein VMU49_02190 [Candidatus Acidoferrales bacterium]|nr:hypothetical protein [Candidatus Acidoferrales bacterium]